MRFFIPILLLSANFAFASSFDGNWTGQGTFATSAWGSHVADPVVIEFKQTGNTLYSKDCWSYVRDGANWRICSSRDLEMSGSVLLYQGHQVGTISSDRIDVRYTVGGGGGVVEASAVLAADGTLEFHYQSIDAQGNFTKTDARALTRN